ncbi:hypothetical protein TTHERM_00283350 (macronuclear) [Tetrahymena thermophila SB210]|uniref:Uncharacterized protein n=1 Tax=Tetrahymena thermophila (strain SB210) TaxID=312017 RepID=I7MEW8_TETTS|nr:hypothetical protein TTHERM_00283350 [Tetrahymena thermophila SB210]EAR97946.1 hypothetical protein TTHERM_00283350 [Tetrahymena thermophila SB210]|eukprot:XP_001018191.1 hypothetical protein TTHERM_00283350 [Tetrahymena thermophila SB210]
MQNSESNRSLQQRDNSASSAAKSSTNTSRPNITKKVDSVKRRSKTITSKNLQQNINNQTLPKQISNENNKNKNELANSEKENIQPNFQKQASLKELNALSALKRLSDFNDYDDFSQNMLDETFRGIHGWNTNEDINSNPASQRVLKEKAVVINKRANLIKKEKAQIQNVSHNNNPFKNVLQNLCNNINNYEKKATQLQNMKESLIETDKENIFEKEKVFLQNGANKGFSNIVQDLKKLQEDLQSPEKARNNSESLNNNATGYVKPLNSNLLKQQIEKKGLVLKQKIDSLNIQSQSRYLGNINIQTPKEQFNPDYKNVQQLLKVTSNEKSLKMKFNEDYSINICSNNNNTHTVAVPEKSQEERVTVCSQQTNNTTYLNTSSSTQEIECVQNQLNQPYLRSRIESYSQVVDEISKKKKNQVIRVADTEKYDKSFVSNPQQNKNSCNTNPDVINNTSITEAAPSQNSNHAEKISSPVINSYQIKKKVDFMHPESENRRSKSINGATSQQHHFLSYQNTLSSQNNINMLLNQGSCNSTNNQTMYNGQQLSRHQPSLKQISKSIQINKNNSTVEKDKEIISNQQSKTNVNNTPNSMQLNSYNKQKDLDINSRVFPHLSDIQHEKKSFQSRLSGLDNDLNPYNIQGNGNNIFYQPNHIPLTPIQFSQSLSRNNYNQKFLVNQNLSDKTNKNDLSCTKSLSQNSQQLLSQNSSSLDKRNIPVQTQGGLSTLVIYTNQNNLNVSNIPSAVQNYSQQPVTSQNYFNAIQKRIIQGNSQISQMNNPQCLLIGNNPQICVQGSGPSRNNSSSKLVLPPKPQSSNINSSANQIQQLSNKSKLPKLFKNSNRTFMKKVNSRNEELKGLQIQAQKAINNSFT